MLKELQALVGRLQDWPEHAQQQALAAVQDVEREFQEPYELTDEDRAAIERGIADADAGRFATEEEMESLFARYRIR